MLTRPALSKPRPMPRSRSQGQGITSLLWLVATPQPQVFSVTYRGIFDIGKRLIYTSTSSHCQSRRTRSSTALQKAHSDEEKMERAASGGSMVLPSPLSQSSARPLPSHDQSQRYCDDFIAQLRNSIGIGKMIVEFFSAEMVLSV